jgi:hypothetical protein
MNALIAFLAFWVGTALVSYHYDAPVPPKLRAWRAAIWLPFWIGYIVRLASDFIEDRLS